MSLHDKIDQLYDRYRCQICGTLCNHSQGYAYWTLMEGSKGMKPGPSVFAQWPRDLSCVFPGVFVSDGFDKICTGWGRRKSAALQAANQWILVATKKTANRLDMVMYRIMASSVAFLACLFQFERHNSLWNSVQCGSDNSRVHLSYRKRKKVH